MKKMRKYSTIAVITISDDLKKKKLLKSTCSINKEVLVDVANKTYIHCQNFSAYST